MHGVICATLIPSVTSKVFHVSLIKSNTMYNALLQCSVYTRILSHLKVTNGLKIASHGLLVDAICVHVLESWVVRWLSRNVKPRIVTIMASSRWSCLVTVQCQRSQRASQGTAHKNRHCSKLFHSASVRSLSYVLVAGHSQRALTTNQRKAVDINNQSAHNNRPRTVWLA